MDLNFQAIHIQWDNPIDFSKINEENIETTDYGVYQIYGPHPVYGSNVLLYIGKADEQTFGKRIGQHDYWANSPWENKSNKIHIGRLIGETTPENNDEWSLQIDVTEQMLIYSHSPAYNSQHISSIQEDKVKDYIVFNWGNRGSLSGEVSGMRLTNMYWEERKINIENFTPYKYNNP